MSFRVLLLYDYPLTTDSLSHSLVSLRPAITIARNAAKYDFAESEVKVFVHDEDIVVGDGVIT